MRKFFLAALLLAASLARAEVIDIDNAELAKLAASGVPVIDIRTAAEWQESGVLAGSRLITLFDERGNADPAAWLKRVQSVAGPQQPVVLICRSGNRTKAASHLLTEQAGYAKVYNVKNGIRAWAMDGRPLVAAAAECKAGKTC